jgi:hypothetical protein
MSCRHLFLWMVAMICWQESSLGLGLGNAFLKS